MEKGLYKIMNQKKKKELIALAKQNENPIKYCNHCKKTKQSIFYQTELKGPVCEKCYPAMLAKRPEEIEVGEDVS